MRKLLLMASVLALGLASAPVSAAPADPGASLDALRWRNIGPFRGGRATAVAGVPREPFTVFMGTAGAGVWKTTDAGVSWANVSDRSVATASVGAVAVAPSNPQIVYVGMGEATARANTLHSGDGIYRSGDGGKTWIHLGLERTRSISRIVVDPRDPDRVFVAAQGPLYAPSQARGVFRSTDGGRTWKRVLFTGETVGPADLAMDPKDSRVLYAAMWDHRRLPWQMQAFRPDSGLYKSTDAGETWTKLTAGLPAGIGKSSISTTSDPKRVYALVSTSQAGRSGLYRSDDAGASWTLINADRNLTRRPWYFCKVFADPVDPKSVWVADLSLWKSSDGGETFSNVETPHGDHHELWIDPENPRIVAEADDGGGTVSLDGGRTWSPEENQPTAQIYRAVADNGFPYRLYGAQQDNTSLSLPSASFDHAGIGQEAWRPAAGYENSFVDLDPDHPDVTWASGELGGEVQELSGLTGSEKSFSPYPVLLWGTSASRFSKYRFVLNTPIFKSRYQPKTLYLGAQKLLATDDDGKTWREVSPDLTRAGADAKALHPGTGESGDGAYDAIDYAAESPLRAGVLWTGSDDGLVGVSLDGGRSWRTSPLPGIPDARINAIDPSWHGIATAYVAATRFQFDDEQPYLFKTGDGGKTWTRIDQGLPRDAWAHVVREDPVRKGLLYAGTDRGVFVSFDDGGSWRPLQSNLPVTPINDLLVHDGDLIAATSGRGFWVLDDVAPLRELDPAAVTRAHLFKPRPAYRSSLGRLAFPMTGPSNGHNPPIGAVLDLELPANAPVVIEILDASGTVVRRFRSGEKAASDTAIKVAPGLNRIVWDLRETAVPTLADALVFGGGAVEGRWAPPGDYTVRLTVGGDVEVQPLQVRPQPGTDAPPGAYAAQDAFLKAIEADLSAFRAAELKARSVRKALADDTKGVNDPALLARAKQLQTQLDVDLEPYGDMAYLQAKGNQVVPFVEPSARALYDKLHPMLQAEVAQIDAALQRDLPATNALLAKAGKAPIRP